jgi:hypothetical protein
MSKTHVNWPHPVRRETVFRVFRDARGCWCACSSDGLVGGTFFAREAAVRFARREASASPRPCCGPHRR